MGEEGTKAVLNIFCKFSEFWQRMLWATFPKLISQNYAGLNYTLEHSI